MKVSQKLHQAVESGNIEAIRSLVEELPFDALQSFADGYLFILAFEGYESIIRYLHGHKMVLGARDETGATVLHYAALGGHLELVQCLHQEGGDIHTRSNEGKTLLHAAAIYGSLSLIKYFCEHGVSVHAVSNNGHTALHLVAVAGMLREGADPHYIAAEEHEAIAYLQQQGGDLEAADKDGRTVSELLAMWQEEQSAPMWISKNNNK